MAAASPEMCADGVEVVFTDYRAAAGVDFAATSANFVAVLREYGAAQAEAERRRIVDWLRRNADEVKSRVLAGALDEVSEALERGYW